MTFLRTLSAIAAVLTVCNFAGAGAVTAADMKSKDATAAAPNAMLQQRLEDAVKRGDLPAIRSALPATSTATTTYFPGRRGSDTQENITYEELKACGFYAEETRLECTLEVKQASGYNGQIGQFGSMEHVYFCALVLNTSFIGWYPLGIGSVQVHDESAGGTPPWDVAVYRDFNPPGQVRMVDNSAHTSVTTQTMGQTYLIKAVLSYWMPVDNCNTTPVWGNSIIFPIRADPIR
jgi:hypothetical protein